jgi:hypothetical protein
MSDYAPLTVAVATVRGFKGVKVFRIDAGWHSVDTVAGCLFHPDSRVTDVRPLVVLNPDSDLMRRFMRYSHEMCSVSRDLRDEIEAQTKPPIPEPGLWAVVEAGHAHLEGKRAEFVRIPEGSHPGLRWFDTSWESDFAAWDSLIDPVLVREGVQS